MSDRHLIILVEESDSSLGFYDSLDGSEEGRIKLGLWPHEVAVSSDGKTAFVTNFGLRDYDLTIGHAGNSISIIDIPNRCEVHRFYTCTKGFRYWGPHGVKISPDGKYLYVNVERVVGLRDPDPTAGPGQEQTQILVFEIETRKIVNTFALPLNSIQTDFIDKPLLIGEVPIQSYGVPRGSHNFVFSPDGKDLWIFSGRGGISRLNPTTGEVTAHLIDFNGAVRGLAFTTSGKLLVSATNEISIVNPATLKIDKKIGNLGVTQILYSQATPDEKYVLAPAVWEGQVLIIDLELEKVVKRVITGVDPVHIINAPTGNSAYVTHGRSKWAAEISFENFEVSRRIETRGGPNGVDVATWSDRPNPKKLLVGACLPFTGENAIEGREIRLGYDFWKDQVNASGGIVIDDVTHQVEIVYSDTESKTEEKFISELAEDLVASQKAQFILGTYPSVCNFYVGKVAENLKTLFVTATGDLEEIYDQGFKFVFGIMTLTDVKMKGVISSLWRTVSPKPRTLVIFSCDDEETIREATRTSKFVTEKGLQLLYPENPPKGVKIIEPGIIVYSHLTSDFKNIIEIIQNLSPDLFINLGHRSEGIAITEMCKKLNFTPGTLAFDFGITIPAFRTQLKDDVQNLIGSIQWTESLDNCAHDRFVTAQDFSRNYFIEFSEKPSYLAAGAAACGVVLEKAIGAVNTINSDEVRQSLLDMDRPTFFGHVKFDERGLNIAKPLITVQLREDENELKELIIDPLVESGKNRPVFPFPGWQ